MRQAIAMLGLVAVLAGCCTLPFDPQDVPVGAPAEGGLAPGDGVRTLTVEVLVPDEPAPDGTPVIVFWADDRAAPGNDTRLLAVALRTQDGAVRARVPFTTLHVTAGGGAFTEEWQPDAVPAGAQDTTLRMRVYPAYANGTLSGTWEPGAVSTYGTAGNGFIEWVPHDIRPGASEESQAGYARRLQWARIEVAWENRALAQADLGLAAVTDPGVLGENGGEQVRCTYKDAAQDLGGQGPRNETFHSDVDPVDVGCGTLRDQGDGARILAGPATDDAAVMPLGLPYTLTYELGFGYAAGIEQLCERLPGDVVIAYIEPETGEQGPDQAPQGDGVSEFDAPAPAWAFVAALLGALAAWKRRRAGP